MIHNSLSYPTIELVIATRYDSPRVQRARRRHPVFFPAPCYSPYRPVVDFEVWTEQHFFRPPDHMPPTPVLSPINPSPEEIPSLDLDAQNRTDTTEHNPDHEMANINIRRNANFTMVLRFFEKLVRRKNGDQD
ncbi:hypothetical protein SISSUDRAFT_1057273 [Sistotremastrum suecicum HHB10207 ss-3]|uniref:Uncharacterized protein n=1 Tax=Sistotremastrum suecicum HHB10207 ss-3 TaxID=1314776 RepID=A0A166IGN6_9AGAM|nr:hypothetical protein SISSUDRAFT_1057273 [Sistotremastrum suecicum HHB10207 ss-3]